MGGWWNVVQLDFNHHTVLIVPLCKITRLSKVTRSSEMLPVCKVSAIVRYIGKKAKVKSRDTIVKAHIAVFVKHTF